MQAAGEAEHVRPVPAHPVQVEPAPGERGEGAVVRPGVDPPQLLVGHVGEAGTEAPAEQGDEAEDDVGVRGGGGHEQLGGDAAVLVVHRVEQDQAVAQGAGDEDAGEAGDLVVDHVEPGAAAPSQVPPRPWPK